MRKKIAVVEDNADHRLLVQVVLDAEYEIQEYEDGPTALTGLRGDAPDLVLLDISLPGMDGVEILRGLRRKLGGTRRRVLMAEDEEDARLL
jgi:CheY-like chemotaxis protein